MPAISAAPTVWRPAFVGGSLGSGLNASLLRKLQILAYWLGAIFPGATFTYVQGSPSGSGASGGTHTGPGDAADLEVLLNGKPAPTRVYVIASLILRLLGCIAWVRGQDVNGDGVKDDSFAAHLHAIDREGSVKVPAAAAQIGQYLLHQNGLIGGRTDCEVLVRDPLWLDTYTDDQFRTRFMALTPAAAAIAAHIEPTQEDDMPRLRLDTQGTGWFLTDRGAVTIDTTDDAKILRRVLDAKDYLVAEDRVLPGEIAVYQKYLARANGAAAPTTTTVTAVLDPAALNAAFDAALANVAFTTRKA